MRTFSFHWRSCRSPGRGNSDHKTQPSSMWWGLLEMGPSSVSGDSEGALFHQTGSWFARGKWQLGRAWIRKVLSALPRTLNTFTGRRWRVIIEAWAAQADEIWDLEDHSGAVLRQNRAMAPSRSILLGWWPEKQWESPENSIYLKPKGCP